MKSMKRNVQKGFTLIELMIVIAIVAILVALAVPAYQDYAVRAKVGECIGQAASAKLAVAEHYQSLGSLPADETAAGIDFDVTQYCSSMTILAGVIAVVADGGAIGAEASANQTATFTPTVGGGNITTWVCTYSGDAKYFPSSCRNT